MTNQLIINVTPFENRVALLENGVVLELLIDRSADRGLVGDIYLGKVQRVLPGMQAAFVELGGDKAAFLYVRDVLPPEIPEEEVEADLIEEQLVSSDDTVENLIDLEEPEAKINYERRKRVKHKIEDLLKPGQDILVQVTKDSIGTKGPRVTCNISIPGRHVVFMPTYDHVGISRKIAESVERERLKRILSEQRPKGCGFVARTVSQGVADEKLEADCAFLVSIWRDILKRQQLLKAPTLIQPELDLILKCARDMTNEQLDKIVVDDAESFDKIKRFLKFLEPKLVDKLELYTDVEPIFEHYSLEAEITKAMSRKVWLRSGGYLVIDQAEALSAIDVNTGKFVGKRNLDETILRTNLEAVREVAYQLRLRNIGGMVIIDFIDMESQEDRDKVLFSLLDALKKDKARCNVVKISELGLVEMTRQRNRESLERQLCEPCFYCDGKGSLKSKRTVAYDVFRTLMQKAKLFNEPSVVVNAH
ncbi:MAG: Rne/Rng family ribonuclease, partial [bacterium]|nr:Rne/Rng family ribonuclease [bacterium]